MNPRLELLLVLSVILVSAGCDGGQPRPRDATLHVRTSGSEPDHDGYFVTLRDMSSTGHPEGGRFGIAARGPRPFRVAANDVRSLQVPGDVVEIAISGIAPNCTVEGSATRSTRSLADQDSIAFMVRCMETGPRYAVPEPGDWRLEGVALRPGPGTDRWDSRLDGMITPTAVLKQDDRYLLYYIGADGDRSTDGGPRNRALGVAVSSDGIAFDRLDEPILRHQPHGNQEEGVFSAAVLSTGSDIAVVYGAMTAPNDSSESVDGAAILSRSADGLSLEPGTEVIDPRDSTVYNHGDEIFPIAGFQGPDEDWHVYYVAKGRLALWILGVASGPALSSLETHAAALDLRPDWISAGGNPQWLSRFELAFPVVTNSNHTRHSVSGSDGLDNVVELRSVSVHRPADLSTVLARYSLPAEQAIILRDDDEDRWLLYALSTVDQSVTVYSAPLRSDGGS